MALMLQDHSDGLHGQAAPGRGFGLGFQLHQDREASGLPLSDGSFGWGGACHSTYWVDPAEQLVAVYFTQVIPAAGLDDHAAFRHGVYAALMQTTDG